MRLFCCDLKTWLCERFLQMLSFIANQLSSEPYCTAPNALTAGFSRYLALVNIENSQIPSKLVKHVH